MFDPRLLRESRQMEIDFMSQLEVCCKRLKQWASTILVVLHEICGNPVTILSSLLMLT